MYCPDCGSSLPVSVTAEYTDEIVKLNQKLKETKKLLRAARQCLSAIEDYDPEEVAYDEFAYWRMVDSFRKAASAGLDDSE